MKPYKFFFCFLLSLYIVNALPAQIVHAGLWTGYLDGIGINSMALKDTFLYIKTYSGTAFVNTHTRQTRFFYDMGNPDLPISVDLRISAVDKQGNLWTFINNQLVKISPNGTIQYVGGMPDYQVLVLKFDNTGQLWAGMVTEPINNPATSKCLAKFTDMGWQNIDLGQTRMNIHDIVFDHQNQPYVVARSAFNPGGIFHFDGASFVKIPNSPSYFRVAVSTDGQIASCGSEGSGTVLKVYKNGVWTSYGQLNTSLPPVFRLPYFDANNVLWVGHGYGSVYKLENDALEQQLSTPTNYRTGPLDGLITSGFAFDDQGFMWLGTNDGLFSASVEDQQEWEFVQTADLLCPESPNSIAVFQDTIWLANNDGITRVVNSNWEKLDYPANQRPILFYDSLRQGLWVGANGPLLDFYQGEHHTHFEIEPQYINSSYPWVDGITSDVNGNIWLHNAKALFRYDLDGNWHVFNCGDEFSKYFTIDNIYPKDDFMYLSVGGFYPWLPNVKHDTLYKIKDDLVFKVDVPQDVLLQTNEFSIISEQDIWFQGSNNILHYKDGQILTYKPSDIGGNLGHQHIVLYNDSIVLVCSDYGLYIFKEGQWFYPTIPSNRIFNRRADVWNLSADHKLYMGYSPLLVLEDINALLDQLQTSAIKPDQGFNALVYPNPVTDLLYLDKIIASQGPNLTALLYNAYGQLIETFSEPVPNTLDLGRQPKGVYFLSIKSDNQLIPKSFKIVKE